MQNSLATAGTNFTKSGAQNKVDTCKLEEDFIPSQKSLMKMTPSSTFEENSVQKKPVLDPDCSWIKRALGTKEGTL